MRLIFNVKACSSGADSIKDSIFDPLYPVSHPFRITQIIDPPLELILELSSLYLVNYIKILSKNIDEIIIWGSDRDPYANYQKIISKRDLNPLCELDIRQNLKYVKIQIYPSHINQSQINGLQIEGEIGVEKMQKLMEDNKVDSILRENGIKLTKNNHMDLIIAQLKKNQDNNDIIQIAIMDKKQIQEIYIQIKTIQNNIITQQKNQNYEMMLELKSKIQQLYKQIQYIEEKWPYKYIKKQEHGSNMEILDIIIQNTIFEDLEGVQNGIKPFGKVFNQCFFESDQQLSSLSRKVLQQMLELYKFESDELKGTLDCVLILFQNNETDIANSIFLSILKNQLIQNFGLFLNFFDIIKIIYNKYQKVTQKELINIYSNCRQQQILETFLDVLFKLQKILDDIQNDSQDIKIEKLKLIDVVVKHYNNLNQNQEQQLLKLQEQNQSLGDLFQNLNKVRDNFLIKQEKNNQLELQKKLDFKKEELYQLSEMMQSQNNQSQNKQEDERSINIDQIKSNDQTYKQESQQQQSPGEPLTKESQPEKPNREQKKGGCFIF